MILFKCFRSAFLFDLQLEPGLELFGVCDLLHGLKSIDSFIFDLLLSDKSFETSPFKHDTKADFGLSNFGILILLIILYGVDDLYFR